MGSIVEKETEGLYDVEETIFVAVGKSVKKSGDTLLWAAQNFSGKKLCLIHAHRPARTLSPMGSELIKSEPKLCTAEAVSEVERPEVHEVLDQFDLVLAKTGVKAHKIFIEMNNIDKGIVEIISRFGIKWLVMGGAADEYYSNELSELKSKKAIFVCQQAPLFCHIWFVCKGRLIYTREGREVIADTGLDPPLLLLNSNSKLEEGEELKMGSVPLLLDGNEDAENFERISHPPCSVRPSSVDGVVCSLNSSLLLRDEERTLDCPTGGAYCELEQAFIDAKNSKQKACQYLVKRWKEEDYGMEARCKALAFETLCAKKMSERKEMEELLAIKEHEAESMKNQLDELKKELNVVQQQKLEFETQVIESQSLVKELEEKILTAVELLKSFRKQRDELRIECGNAVTEVKQLRKLITEGIGIFPRAQILSFSFLEINEATQNFDPSLKIGDGRYGSIYKGILRHVRVAIRMLPSDGSQGDLDFLHEVNVLSSVRHPNLVTLIGTCAESRSLVYEYLRNGSIEDCLASRGSTRLPWETRLQVANQICSALIFLHSSDPCIVHGNVRPSKVLLDANYSCKLGDLGLSQLVPQGESLNKTDADISLFMDPHYLATGKLTPASDIYSFGIILLLLLTNRPLQGVLTDVKCALERGKLDAILDYSAGDWPIDLAKQLACVALRCCETNWFSGPDLVSEVWSVLEPLRDLFTSETLRMSSKETRRVPSHFLCPIFQEVMKDPQIAADGYTYEGDAIRGWLNSNHDTSPMTNLKLDHCNLIPNHTLHYAILEWQQKL